MISSFDLLKRNAYDLNFHSAYLGVVFLYGFDDGAAKILLL